MKRVTRSKRISAMFAMAGMLFMNAGALHAAPVTLTGNDGSATIVGDLVSFENGIYVVKTAIGHLEISADLATCEGPGCPVLVAPTTYSGEDVRIAGSAVVGDNLLPFLLIGYAGEFSGSANTRSSSVASEAIYTLTSGDTPPKPVGTFLISSTNALTGFAELLDKTAQIAISSRRILPSEARALREDEAGNMVSLSQEHVIATENVVIIVHPSNPLTSISMDDLERVFIGEYTNWDQLGAPSGPITVHAAAEDSAVQAFFNRQVLDVRGAVSSSIWQLDATERDTASAVAIDPSSIGYVGAAALHGVSTLDISDTCGITYSPDAFLAKSQDYPLTRRIFAYNRSDVTTPEMDGFIDYITSSNADLIVDSSGYESLGVMRVGQTATETQIRGRILESRDALEVETLRTMAAVIPKWDRLSSTVRFVGNSDRLDNKAILDIDRLIDFLMNEPSGTRVMSVGFTDSEGPMPGNLDISTKRAGIVLDLIKTRAAGRLDHIEFSTQAFGEIAPVACNDASYAKAINARVEIWIRD